METPKIDYYIGTITKIIDPDLYEVEITVPGVFKDRKAFPMKGELDEPKVGDPVIVMSLDPVFHSLYLYQGLRENKVIGIRSRGKKITMNEDEVVISTFSEISKSGKDTPYPDDTNPEPKSWIKISKEGDLDVFMEGAGHVQVTKDLTVKIDGKADIVVTGACTIQSPSVKVTGGDLETVNGGAAKPNGKGGFCGIPVCPLTGAQHVGNKISGT